ncbi:MAG: hypothetical protein COA79_10280 [Planctomycetota bacterium]|nr:MAG: hypothetical protein COA79_10280 [Planctomycetota bacterium]
MKWLFKVFPFLIILILLLGFFFNPVKNDHVDAIFEAKIQFKAENKTKGKISKKINKLLTSKPVRKTKSAFLTYHDYYIFSYTSTKLFKKKITYGFLGIVFLF